MGVTSRRVTSQRLEQPEKFYQESGALGCAQRCCPMSSVEGKVGELRSIHVKQRSRLLVTHLLREKEGASQGLDLLQNLTGR